MSLLKDVIGHEKQKNILLSALKRGREATSYLFSGESGIGKATFSLEYAKAVNCLEPVETDGLMDACDSCSSCKKLSSLNHPDLKIVQPDGDVIKIDQIREVAEFLSFTPFEGKKKVVVIDEAERMNQSAQNAFLKTLEEPPDDSLIILITSSEDTLLETIRSRCFRIKFAPLSNIETEEVLRRQGIKSDTLKGLFSGRPGLMHQNKDFTIEDVLEGLAHDIKKRALTRKLADRAEAELWLSSMLVVLRDMLVWQVFNDSERLLLSEKKLGHIRKIEDSSLKFIIDKYNKINQLRAALKQNINLSLLSNYMSLSLEELYGRDNS
jgi:DNA polymerase-3 subunit delta'